MSKRDNDGDGVAIKKSNNKSKTSRRKSKQEDLKLAATTVPTLLGPCIGIVNIKLWELMREPTQAETWSSPLTRFWIFRKTLVFAPVNMSAKQRACLNNMPVFAGENAPSMAKSIATCHLRHCYSRNELDVINQVYVIEMTYNKHTGHFLTWFPNQLVIPSGSRKKRLLQITSDRNMVQWDMNNEMPVHAFASAVNDLLKQAQQHPKRYIGVSNISIPVSIVHAPTLVLDPQLPTTMKHEYCVDCWRTRSLEELCEPTGEKPSDAKVAWSITDYIATRCYPSYDSYMSPIYGNWAKLKHLGRGHFGTVVKMPWIMPTNNKPRTVVVKLTNADIDQTDIEGTIGEASVGKLLKSSLLTPDQRTIMREHTCEILGWTNYGQHFGVIMEHEKGSNLKQWIKREEAIMDNIRTPIKLHQRQLQTTFSVLCMLTDVLRVLWLMHDRLGYVHRDIKPENILVGKDYMAKLIDYGMMAPLGFTVGYAATRRYALPELVNMKDKMDNGKGVQKIIHHNGAADIFSVVVMLNKWSEQGIILLPQTLAQVVDEVMKAKKLVDVHVNACDMIQLLTTAAEETLEVKNRTVVENKQLSRSLRSIRWPSNNNNNNNMIGAKPHKLLVSRRSNNKSKK